MTPPSDIGPDPAAPFPRGSLGHAALTYAKAGWPVFPLQPGTKDPFKGSHGFKDATTELARIVQWWSTWPSANIGTPTGVLYDVLDIDARATGHGFDRADRLAAAGLLRGAVARSLTRNGGEQWYYPAADQQSRSIKGQFIDIKANGGYVVAPPSVVPADEGVDGPGQYSWLEFHTTSQGLPLDGAAIKMFLDPPKHSDNIDRTPLRRTGNIGPLQDWLSGQVEGNRNNALYWAAGRALDEGLDPAHLADVATMRLRLSPREVSSTIASARRGCAS